MADLIERIPEGFTPGPWYPGHLCNPAHPCDCRSIFGNDDRMGAVGGVYLDDGENDCPPKGEAVANQLLIALAPELAAGYRAQAGRIAELEAEVARLRKPPDAEERMPRPEPGTEAWKAMVDRAWDAIDPGRHSLFWRRQLDSALRAALAAPDTGGA